MELLYKANIWPNIEMRMYYSIEKKIQVWDWAGVNIKNESQGNEKDSTSIQYHVIQKLKEQNFDIIFDDDNAGEIADVIAIEVDDVNKKVKVELFHLKFSQEDRPGARINDLYAVNGQAQKCVSWLHTRPEHIIGRMLRRGASGPKNRYELGTEEQLSIIREKVKSLYEIEYIVHIVQPGLSKAAASREQLKLLSLTEAFLWETRMIKLGGYRKCIEFPSIEIILSVYMSDVNDFKQEIECIYKDEKYSVRDNGAVFRYPRDGKRPRKYDNFWTFGKPNDKHGYMEIASVRVHIIVATAFHGPKPTKEHVVDHIDTNRRNNRPDNLRWVTRLENALDNPITRKRIIMRCGSIEAFLANPSLLQESDVTPDFSWMRTVTGAEAQVSKERLLAWAESDKQTSGGAFGANGYMVGNQFRKMTVSHRM